MNSKEGKIKAVPVKEVTEGIQVCVHTHRMGIPGYLICLVTEVTSNSIFIQFVDKIQTLPLSQLKTLVVEYEETVVGHDRYGEQEADITRILPLKYSQWQSAIDNDLINKVVEFDIIRHASVSKTECYAKIATQQKKMYTEEELHITKLRAQLSVLNRLESACGRMKIINHSGKWMEIDDYTQELRVSIALLK